MQERQGVSFRRLAWLAALLTVLAAAGAYVAYSELLHYRRRAAEHLPPNAIFAARLDVEQVMLFDPVRRHLLPLLEVLPPARARGAGTEPAAHTRLARLRAAGLNLALDLREIVVAGTADGGWLIALGGLFPEQGLLAIIERVLHQENAAGWQRFDDRLVFSPSGAALAQAADGTLILASERDTLTAALPASARHRDLGLAAEGPGGAVLMPQAARSWYPGPADWLNAARVVGVLRLARELELELRVDMGDPDQARSLAARARQWTSPGSADARDQPAGGEDPLGVLARARAVDVDGTSVKLLSSWRSAELDRSARELAAWLRRQLPPVDRAGS